MFVLQHIIKPVSRLLILSMLGLSLPLSPAQSAMVGTDSVIGKSAAHGQRDRIRTFIDRKDVREQMESIGVSPDEAMARVAALSDQEVANISGKLGQLPAGGDGGSIVGALLLIFFVLLLTDLLGLTHVFPFVYHKR
ncbi:MAG: PA2779 family protein [Chromatiaceae bacterium]